MGYCHRITFDSADVGGCSRFVCTVGEDGADVTDIY